MGIYLVCSVTLLSAVVMVVATILTVVQPLFVLWRVASMVVGNLMSVYHNRTA